LNCVQIAVIVEGHGECEALPIIVRRIALEIDGEFVPRVLAPQRVHAGRFVKAGELERSVELSARKLGGVGGILIVLDCDLLGCCPAQAAPNLRRRARAARPDVAISVVLAKPEFEAWFLAAAESLRGRRGLPADLEAPEDPEGLTSPKGWLSAHFPLGYSETADQPALAAVFDMRAARRAPSFDKCYREIEGLLKSLRMTTKADSPGGSPETKQEGPN